MSQAAQASTAPACVLLHTCLALCGDCSGACDVCDGAVTQALGLVAVVGTALALTRAYQQPCGTRNATDVWLPQLWCCAKAQFVLPSVSLLACMPVRLV